MRFYFSGVSDSNDPRQHDPEARIMRAFSMKTKDTDFSDCFLDSGAFSLRKKIKEDPSYFNGPEFRHYIDTYSDVIKRDKVQLYAVVDVIGDPLATYEVYAYMRREQGLRPIPVIHFGTDPSWVLKYRKVKVLGLGGLVQTRPGEFASPAENKARREWLDKVFSMLPPDGPKIHGFGLANNKLLVRYNWWSVDSTSWLMMASMGMVLVPPKSKGKNRYDLKPFQVVVTGKTQEHIPIESLGRRAKHRVAEWLEEIGIPLDQLREDGNARQAANVLYYQRMASEIDNYPKPEIRTRNTLW